MTDKIVEDIKRMEGEIIRYVSAIYRNGKKGNLPDDFIKEIIFKTVDKSIISLAPSARGHQMVDNILDKAWSLRFQS